MIDLIRDFHKHEKEISRYIKDRVDNYFKSRCYKLLTDRIARMDASWDMEVAGARKGKRGSQGPSNFIAQLTYPLVKEQILVRRAIFNANYRGDPLFSLRAIGQTPDENAINMQDLLESNNEQIRFRQKFLRPSNDMVAKWGASVAFTEYCHNEQRAWKTIADPMLGSKRVYGIVKNSKNAQTYPLDIRNYFQDPSVVSCDESSFRGHTERRTLSWFINRVQSNPDLYIKENVEKIIKRVKDENGLLKDDHYHDPQGPQSRSDFGRIAINDIKRGQFQIHLEGNEDDPTYYYIEMIGDTIVRFQDNPYDMNMNQYTVLLCEPRYEFWWGNTPAEYSIQTENSMNLLNGLGLENAIESMRRYIFYNKNAIDPNVWQSAAYNGKIPVDVNKDVTMGDLLYTYQVPDIARPAIGDAYARLLENNQRVSTTPDLNRPTSAGGPANKTAYAADIMANIGNTQDADILENHSYCLSQVGEKQSIVLAQFLGNWGPIMIRPPQAKSIREVQKAQITGNWSVYLETSLQKSYQGEITRYQNMVTWLLNLTNSGVPIPVDFEPMVRQVVKMGKFVHTDRIIPEQVQQDGGMPQMPGQPPLPPEEMEMEQALLEQPVEEAA